jgi:phosphohistidine swiveling domain-containing protein
MVSHTHLAPLNARESRLPIMVALGNATSLLRDGKIVTVDGTAGTVTEVL